MSTFPVTFLDNTYDSAATASIVSSLVSLYANDGSMLFLRYENKLLSLPTFLSYVVPSIAALRWPLDKDEIARIWHDLYCIHDDMSGVSVDRALLPAVTTRPSDEVILHRGFLFDTITRVSGRRAPDMTVLNIDPVTGEHLHPQSEVRVTTFHAAWFLSHQPYVKRFHVLKEASITTLFIADKPICNGQTRFNLTWLPHAHLNTMEVHRRPAGAWSCVPSGSNAVFTSPVHRRCAQMDLTVLVWNLRGSVIFSFPTTFLKLIHHQKPMMIILTGTAGLRSRDTKFTTSQGYTKQIAKSGAPGTTQGYSVLWNPGLIDIDQHISYPDTTNIRIKHKPLSKTIGILWKMRKSISKVRAFEV